MGKITGVKQPLYGHTSESSAYVVDDYPYGFRARTQIRYWLEGGGKKGFRFVSQTLNPKTGRWNAPKKSTYAELSAAMYIDDKGHVAWHGLTPYSSGDEVVEFMTAFPGANFTQLAPFAKAKVKFLEKYLTGDVFFTINGKKQEQTEADKERTKKDLEMWELAAKGAAA